MGSPDERFQSIGPVEAAAQSWRVAHSLEALRAQINAKWPGRDKSSDGTIGDADHQARHSDHNPDSEGIVRALDITHDPAHGVDTYAIAESLRLSRDPRISYVISNRRIFNSRVSPWEWRPYDGQNPHTAHMHVSVVGDDRLADDTQPWQIEAAVAPQPPQPLPTLPQPATGVAIIAELAHLEQELAQLAPLLNDLKSWLAQGVALQARLEPFATALLGPVPQPPQPPQPLPQPAPSPQVAVQHNIVATKFADATLAYPDVAPGWNERPGVALPARFHGKRPSVKVTGLRTGKSIVCEIIDIGPHHDDATRGPPDPYWETGSRPRAESEPGNHAGIDLTPPADSAIGNDGLGPVDWQFV